MRSSGVSEKQESVEFENRSHFRIFHERVLLIQDIHCIHKLEKQILTGYFLRIPSGLKSEIEADRKTEYDPFQVKIHKFSLMLIVS